MCLSSIVTGRHRRRAVDLGVVRITEGDAGGGLERGQRAAGVPAGEPDQVRQGFGAEF